jgi:hypothetical protein
MTPLDFRRMALSFPETSEKSHMSHPDFRVCGKVFATLGYPDKEFGMVKLTPMQQEEIVADHPMIFVPVKGGWGRSGSTNVRLKAAKKSILKTALLAAWINAAPKSLAKQFAAEK